MLDALGRGQQGPIPALALSEAPAGAADDRRGRLSGAQGRRCGGKGEGLAAADGRTGEERVDCYKKRACASTTCKCAGPDAVFLTDVVLPA